MKGELSSLLVQPETSIRNVMASIDSNLQGIALVVDDAHHLLGTITDGDIRRAILSGISLDTPIRELLARKPPVYQLPVTAPIGSERSVLLALMRERSVRQIPLLDSAGHVAGLATFDELLPREPLALQAVIMAGGFGTRLRPLTDDLPKPMLPVGDKPLLEYTIEQLERAGIQQVYITTHYQPEKIIEHFGDGEAFGVDINYVTEDQPLGTAGALGLMQRPVEPLLVMNGDILTRMDFRAMLSFHRKHQATLTVGVRQYDLQIPYGVLECNGFYIQKLHEKPTYQFLVNAGIYLLEPLVYDYIPAQRHFDMTDLIERLIAAQQVVASFPIVEYWVDIGQPVDYDKVQEDKRNGKI
ncbi:MAG: nucleotidyltransferase family protein [Anaerolineae bacterium]|nr:nucleotidyltransferase family protein [Anaerolineae bacterium]